MREGIFITQAFGTLQQNHKNIKNKIHTRARARARVASTK